MKEEFDKKYNVGNDTIHGVTKRLFKMQVTDANTIRYGDVYAKNLNEAFRFFKRRMQHITYGDTEWKCLNQLD